MSDAAGALSAPPSKPMQKPKVLTDEERREQSAKRAGRRRRAKEEKLSPMDDERTRIAQAAAEAVMSVLGMRPATTTTTYVPPSQAASSNTSAARSRFPPDADASPAPTYGYLPGRDPTPQPFYSIEVEDSSPLRGPAVGSIDLNTGMA